MLESDRLTAQQSVAAMIRLNDVTVRFADGTLAVDSVNVEFQAGKISSLIGPSGCGKTTLLRLIAQLQQATSGRVELEPSASGTAGEVAFVFQQPSLLPWRSVLENVTLPLEIIGRESYSQRRELAMDLLQAVGLTESANQLPDQLSGGMKMRVSLARALVTAPRVLLLDEPFAALDDMLRNQLGQLLLKLWDERRFTAVWVTHNIAESSLLSHQIHVMRASRITRSIDNTLPWPREESLRRKPEFGDFYGMVSDCLRGES